MKIPSFSKKELLVGAGIVVGTIVLLRLLFRKKMNTPFILKGGYVVPKGTPNMADALHSFERRKSDGFGGRMSTQIKEKLRELYKQGINPDVTNLKVVVDSKNYKVDWEATIEPSKDGKAYIGFSTIGSAGGGADQRALNQVEAMKKWVDGAKDYTLVLDFKNPSGIYIRQFFYKYTKPSEFPPR
jgi:hypothetical protein